MDRLRTQGDSLHTYGGSVPPGADGESGIAVSYSAGDDAKLTAAHRVLHGGTPDSKAFAPPEQLVARTKTTRTTTAQLLFPHSDAMAISGEADIGSAVTSSPVVQGAGPTPRKSRAGRPEGSRNKRQSRADRVDRVIEKQSEGGCEGRHFTTTEVTKLSEAWGTEIVQGARTKGRNDVGRYI